MALSDIIEPFTWGAGGSKLTPEEIARQRAIADALTKQGIDFSPIASPWQGAARLADALVGNIKDARAARAEKANGDYNSDILSRVLGGGSDAFPAAPGMSDAPDSASQPTASPVGATDVPTQRVAQAFGDGQQGFVDSLLPAAMKASQATGVDPRIIVAQAALESGYGKHAPGNNLFGIKSHGQSGGNTLATTEVINGKPVRVQDSFRAYDSPTDSVQGYADFINKNPRYQPLKQAQGLDAQLEALGASGYATDPAYAAKVGSIARGIQLPQTATDATNALAAGQTPAPPLPDAVNIPDMPIAGQPVQVAQNVNPNQMSDATALSLLGASAYKPGDINPAIVHALSDPRSSDMTRQIATMLVKQKLDPNAALETEYKRAQIDALQAQAEKNRNPLALNKFGLQPQYGVDAEGNPVILQLGSNGQAVETQLPNGVKLSKAPIKLDAGDHFVLLDPITRQPVGTIQKNLAEAEAQKAAGKAEGGARFDLPRVEQNADLILGVLDRMKTHPGREGSTGFIQGALPSRTSDQVDFQSLVDQTQGQAFLQAFQMLKGGGQITEIEGQKATNAISRLGNERLSDKDYLQAINDLEEVVKAGLARAKVQAGQGGTSASPSNGDGWTNAGNGVKIRVKQ